MVKKCYRLYVTAMALLWITAAMTAPAFAVDDMWTVANKIIVDVYGKIVSISTVLAGLMSAVAVIGAKLSNNQHKVDQAWDWLKRMGHHQRHRRLHCIRRAVVQRPCNADAITLLLLRHEGGVNIA